MPFDFKNASKADLQREYQRIASESGDSTLFAKKELNYLPEILSNGEQVLAFCLGLMGGNTWLLVLTDRRILLLDKGLLYGLKQVSIDLNKVNAVSGKAGLMSGEITITDGAKDHKIANVYKGTVRPFTNKVEEAIQAIRIKQNGSGKDNRDPYAQLEKLASLREKGILSQDEFDREKSKLLGN